MVSRREFLRVGGLGVVGLSVVDRAALARTYEGATARSCIWVLLTGGPSQLDTFDPKPNAPRHIRGPLRAISTTVPGVSFTEALPRLAQRAHRLAVLRSLYHHAAPIHETGFQLLHTGRLSGDSVRFPCFGSVVAAMLGSRNGTPPCVVVPRPLQDTGVNAYRGQSAGLLGRSFEPVSLEQPSGSTQEQTAAARPSASESPAEPSATEPPADVTPADVSRSVRLPSFDEQPERVQRTYGNTRFGRLLWQAARLVETGVRVVVVNLFTRLSGELTWDCHATPPHYPARVLDYRDSLGPEFDAAFSALLDDLDASGLLQETLVVATGEMGRTPQINDRGGRDHWPGVWSAVVAGGGVSGGRVVGSSDRFGAEPVDRPIHPGELTATVYHALGVDRRCVSLLRQDGDVPLCEHEPIRELFG